MHLFLNIKIGVFMYKGLWGFIFFFSLASQALPQKFLDSMMTIPAEKPERWASPALKSAEWRACHQKSSRLFSEAQDTRSLSAFLESSQVISHLEEMDKRGLLRGEVSVSPWSGDYWPYANGLIAARYKDEGFNSQSSWRNKLEYVKTHPLSQVIADEAQSGIDFLSPAEKYDLLTGSAQASLSMSMWAQGENYEDENGEVDSWMGICHGWAAAAIMESRPAKEVQLKSLDEKWTLSLLPSEIKGLISYSWAYNPYSSVSLGSRCNNRDPIRDSNGRLTDPRCQDMNPSTWHQVVVNMVGRQKRSFVMDATYDYEVWNQPVKAYSYTYYNLNTQESSARYQDAILKLSDVKNDKFSSYRSANAQYLIGVEMKLAYVSERPANESPQDFEKNDSVVWVNYRYDLELDSNYKLIGGEWYTEEHPDFVWTPMKNAKPKSTYDTALGAGEWSSEQSVLLKDWAKWARASSDRGEILHRIVEEIVNRSL